MTIACFAVTIRVLCGDDHPGNAIENAPAACFRVTVRVLAGEFGVNTACFAVTVEPHL